MQLRLSTSACDARERVGAPLIQTLLRLWDGAGLAEPEVGLSRGCNAILFRMEEAGSEEERSDGPGVDRNSHGDMDVDFAAMVIGAR
jgi:hypothetical protein